MPIINYELAAKQAEKQFFENANISEVNKKAMLRYLAQYDVHAATRLKFFKHIKFLLEKLSDVEKQMHDRDLVNLTFKSFRDNISAGYYSTLVNVSKAFTRWLNDGDLPKGFKDVKSVSKKDQQRNLDAEDMWTWDDGKKFCKCTNSLQIQAVLMAQLDGGFRPSEFIDLNYGDVVFKQGVVLFRVRGGKTGARDVVCSRCLPYFLQWYDNHPTKRKEDALWIMEFKDKSHPNTKVTKSNGVRRYDYAALKKRVTSIAANAGIKKQTDFYILRHSSCTLDKLDNVPIELAAGRHGHTVEYFTQVYGRLDMDGLAKRLRKHYAGNTEKVCEVCEHINDIGADVCEKCKSPLTVKKALEVQRDQKATIEGIQSQYDKIVLQLKQVSPLLNKLAEKGKLK